MKKLLFTPATTAPTMEEKEEKENTRVSVAKLLEEISTLNVTHLPSFSGQQKPCLYLNFSQ
jgi:hypothetical protein